jgi:hypothetical protein
MTSATLPLEVIHTEQFTSEEIIQKAITTLEDRRKQCDCCYLCTTEEAQIYQNDVSGGLVARISENEVDSILVNSLG